MRHQLIYIYKRLEWGGASIQTRYSGLVAACWWQLAEDVAGLEEYGHTAGVLV